MARIRSLQDDVKRDRASRVEITHTLHLPDGTSEEENLPLVIGVLSDLTGDPKDARPALRDAGRDFVHIHKENFDDVLSAQKPHLNYVVPDLISGKGQIRVDVEFHRMDDFHPDHVVRQVPQLDERLRVRKQLDNLLNLIGSDPQLEARLEEIINDPAKRARFLAEMSDADSHGSTTPSGGNQS